MNRITPSNIFFDENKLTNKSTLTLKNQKISAQNTLRPPLFSKTKISSFKNLSKSIVKNNLIPQKIPLRSLCNRSEDKEIAFNPILEKNNAQNNTPPKDEKNIADQVLHSIPINSAQDESILLNRLKNEIIHYGKSFIDNNFPWCASYFIDYPPIEKSHIKKNIPEFIRGKLHEILHNLSKNKLNIYPTIIIRDKKSGLNAQLAFFRNGDSDEIQPVLFFNGLGNFQYQRNLWNALSNICGQLPIDMEAATHLSNNIEQYLKSHRVKFKELMVGGYSKGGAVATYVGAVNHLRSFSINGLPLGLKAQAIFDQHNDENTKKFHGMNSILLTAKGDWIAQGNFIKCLISLFSCCKKGNHGKEIILENAGTHHHAKLPERIIPL